MAGLGKTKPGYASKGGRKKRNETEVAGPYRSQSSVPSIRKKATKHEHRKVPAPPESNPFKVAPPHTPKNPRQDSAKLKRFKKEWEDEQESGLNPTDVINLVKRAAGLDKSETLTPGASSAREFVVGPAEELLEVSKHNLDRLKKGRPAEPTSRANLAAAATILSAASGGAGASAVEKGAARGISGISDALSAAKLGEKGAAKLRTAPKAAANAIREAPAKKLASVKSAPKRAVETVKKAPTLKTASGQKAAAKVLGRKAASHPLRSGYAGAVLLPEGVLPDDLTKRARAFAEGTYNAVTQHPGEVAETTGQGLLGLGTVPLSLAGAAVESAGDLNTKPLRHQIRDLIYIPPDKTGTGRPGGVIGMTESLVSGNPKTVEETTRKEAGVATFIPLPHLLKRLKGTPLYEDAIRGTLRDTVEGRRALRRELALEDLRAAAESGRHVSKREAQRIKHSVADSQRPGESYVMRPLGRLIEKQRERHYIAREGARMGAGEMAGALAVEKVAKKLRRSKGTNQKEINHGEAVRILGKHGIPVTPESIDFIRRVHEGYEPWKHGDTPLKGEVLDRHATKYILDHPEVLSDKHIAAGLAELNKQSELIGGHSRRNQLMAQRDNLVNPIRKEEGKAPILAPEEQIPAAAAKYLPDKPDGTEWSRSDAYELAISREEQLKEVRKEAADLEEKGGTPETVNALRRQAARIQKSQKGFFQAMKGIMAPPEWGGPEGGVSTTRAVAWTDTMEKKFSKQMTAEQKRLGLTEPTPYLADRFPKGLEQDQIAPSFRQAVPLNKVWPSRGIAARSGNALADLESTLYGSLAVPLQRKAAIKSLKRIFSNIERPLEGKRVFTTRQAERLANEGRVPDGTLFVRRQALRALVEKSDELTPENFSAALAREIEIGQKIASGEEIASAIKEADQMGLRGDKVVPVGAVAMHELMGQLNGPVGVSIGVGRATNFTTRLILNSPAFEISQFAQEGVPMAAALARDVVNVPRAIAAVKQISEYPPELQAEIMASVGTSAGLMGAPSLKALRSESYLNPARAAAHANAWQAFWKLANGTYLSRFDRARAGVMREVGAVSKIEGDFRRAEKGFKLWRSSANNLFKGMNDAVEAMQGMTPEERLAYVASHPKLGDRLQQSMDGLAGNWNSFTTFEKNIAPFTIFYAYQRYVVLWALFHFPLDHPVVATALAMGGEANAQQLQKIAAEHGGTPTALDYTKPVVNGSVLPSGARFSPVLGAPEQAIIEGKPTALLSALPPTYSIPLEAIVGKNFFTGRDLGENGWLYMLRQAGNLMPLVRYLGWPKAGEEKSAGSKLFEEQDPLRSERSVLWPFIAQSGEQFGKEKGLEHLFKVREGEGNIPGALDSSLVQRMVDELDEHPERLPTLERELLGKVHAQERASNTLKRKESKFFPKGSGFNKAQETILEVAENAWQTGPNTAPKTPLEKAEAVLDGSTNERLRKAEEALDGASNPKLERAEEALGFR